MIYQKLWIENFRSLDSVSIDGLGKVNILVGPNNSGKTSVLEALWLLQGPGNPTLTANVAAFRGQGDTLQPPDPIWRYLFNNFDTRRVIEIGAKQNSGSTEKLRISITNRWPNDADENGTRPASSLVPDVSDSSLSTPEVLEYVFRTDGLAQEKSSIAIGLGRVAINVNSRVPIRSSVFLAARHRNSSEELATRFTKLQDSIGTDRLVQSLKVLEPGIHDVSIGYKAQGPQSQVQLRAHIEGISAPIPVSLLGEGVGRLLEILLAAVEVPDGLLLIDEFENGLYFRSLEPAWRSVEAAISGTNTQLFVTTHSAECVAAAVRAFSGPSVGDFRLFRIERKQTGIDIIRFDHEKASTALEFELEVR